MPKSKAKTQRDQTEGMGGINTSTGKPCPKIETVAAPETCKAGDGQSPSTGSLGERAAEAAKLATALQHEGNFVGELVCAIGAAQLLQLDKLLNRAPNEPKSAISTGSKDAATKP